MIRSLNGDQAMAHGALSSGIKLVTSYPGSPSSGTIEALIGLDNQSSAASGYQSNPGVGRDARGKKARALDIEEIAQACGIERVIACEANGPQTALVARFRDALLHREPTMMIIQILRGSSET